MGKKLKKKKTTTTTKDGKDSSFQNHFSTSSDDTNKNPFPDLQYSFKYQKNGKAFLLKKLDLEQ
jgi:hypothetical protein